MVTSTSGRSRARSDRRATTGSIRTSRVDEARTATQLADFAYGVRVPIQSLVRRRLGRLLVVLFSCAVSAGVAVAASAAGAVSPAGTAVAARTSKTTTPPTAGGARGKVTFVGPSSFTIQTSGRRMGMLNALTASANSVTGKDYPYVWGGGHGAAGVASVGVRGPGHTAREPATTARGRLRRCSRASACGPPAPGCPTMPV